MRLKASGFVFWALFVACSSDKSDDDDTGGKSGSGGSVTSGGASGAGKSGAGGTTAGAGSGGGAGKAGGTGGTLAGQGGSSAGAAASAGMDNDPSILASEPVEIDELELDAERVYWLEGHKDILSVPVGGGTPSVVYASATPDQGSGGGAWEGTHIAIDDKNLYFTDQGNRGEGFERGVYSVPLDGSAERKLLVSAPMNYLIGNLSVDAGYIYFMASNSIARIPTSGGTATALLRDFYNESPLVVHDGYVYYWYAAGAADVSQVYRLPVDSNAGPFMDANATAGAGGFAGSSAGSSAGGAGGEGGGNDGAPAEPEQVSTNTRFSELILAPKVDQNYVYWAIYDELYRFPTNGGAAEMFGTLTFGTSASLLFADSGNLYWGSGSLFEYVVGGDSNTSVAAAKQGIYDIAVNADSIFLADGKLVRRVERPKR